ncbi:hypothetical protein SAMD00019534_042970, partial [Acytostelium subglobosum LB1]|uniref:hypothetical protein n=1 Tax=Acytostelium subglobosum LB1 TaxID=1410327 RepID=UPI000644D01D
RDMRSNIKGGVWKNTEDEILKVAVMKYGKNQWARISSLLIKKSPAQCKARWYEWLDPSIKKTEWSKEEEEKLLHLAKIFPAQWKTIAPLVGRTASQCLEHYNRLLDAVQEKHAGEDDPRRLRAGEVEANPETKPAKPDPVDMDEDEKETLSEAKARLSNTQGKKEKRKFREKQLEEARRLAYLQKKRELKAAGIVLHEKKKNKEKRFDYAQEIPFYRKPMAGFYDTAAESVVDPRKDKEFINQRLSKIEGETKAEQQERANKQADLDKKKKEMTNMPGLIKEVAKMNDPEMTRKRSKLLLPEPQLTDDDLAEIAEFEKANRNAMVAGDRSATGALVGTMRPPTELPSSKLVARTPMREDVIMMESQNLLAMANAQTPLKGGANPKLHPSDFSGATPKPMVARTPLRTPNPLAQGITPRKDHPVDSVEDRSNKAQHKQSIATGLKNLPAPESNFKISLPDEPALEDINDDEQLDLDQSETDLRAQQELKHKEQFRLRNRSSTLKKQLPRARTLAYNNVEHCQPLVAPSGGEEDIDETLQKGIDQLVINEILAVINHDNLMFPMDGERPDSNLQSDFNYFSDKEMAEAQTLIKKEMEAIRSPLTSEQVVEHFVNPWEFVHSNYVFIESQQQFVERANISAEQMVATLQAEFDAITKSIKKNATRAHTTEKKLTAELAPLQSSLATKAKEMQQLMEQVEQSDIELECFKQLRLQEQRGVESRVKHIQDQVYEQCDRENRNQMKYAKLLQELNELKEGVDGHSNNNNNHSNNNNNNNHKQ